MKLENQVCSLEQAKRLNELGIIQESLFYYCQDIPPNNPSLHYYGYAQENIPIDLLFGKQSELSTSNLFFEYSTFTVAELGVMIPDSYYLPVNKGNNGWWISNIRTEDESKLASIEAEARAEMLIYLLENSLITAEEVNQRLAA